MDMKAKLRPVKGWTWLNLIFGTLLFPLAYANYLESDWFWFWWDIFFGVGNLLIVWRDIKPSK